MTSRRAPLGKMDWEWYEAKVLQDDDIEDWE
jgi:hypothetical protein